MTVVTNFTQKLLEKMSIGIWFSHDSPNSFKKLDITKDSIKVVNGTNSDLIEQGKLSWTVDLIFFCRNFESEEGMLVSKFSFENLTLEELHKTVLETASKDVEAMKGEEPKIPKWVVNVGYLARPTAKEMDYRPFADFVKEHGFFNYQAPWQKELQIKREERNQELLSLEDIKTKTLPKLGE